MANDNGSRIANDNDSRMANEQKKFISRSFSVKLKLIKEIQMIFALFKSESVNNH